MKRIIMLLLAITCVLVHRAQDVVVWKDPRAVNMPIWEKMFKVTEVEFSESETVMHLHVNYRHGIWIKFASSSVLRTADGKEYALTGGGQTRPEESSFEPDSLFWMPDGDEADLALHFEPLPTNTPSFDFIEGNERGAFRIWSITDAGGKKVEDFFDSSWRNEATGDWEIGFYEHFAIYDCRFWKYESRSGKKGRYELTLGDGKDKLRVSVGKEKGGRRQMSIGGKASQSYSQISSKCLPDYPCPDESALKDNGFAEGDSVTLVGWFKDWPEELLDENREFEITGCKLLTRSDLNFYGKIDSLGRFRLKVPVENVLNTYMDWRRAHIVTLLEPGETYLLLMDLKSGCRMFMGKNARLQNELLANAIEFEYPYWKDGKRMSEEDASAYKNKWAAAYCLNLAKIDSVVALHPAISRKYHDYQREYAKYLMASQLLQVQFYTQDRKLPEEILRYVEETVVADMRKPYTQVREFTWFLYYYLLQGLDSRPKRLSSKVILPEMVLRLEQDGIMAFTDAEHETLRKWQEQIDDYKVWGELESEEEKKKFRMTMDEKYASLIDELRELFKKEGINEVLEQVGSTGKPMERERMVIDSLFTDQTLRDICLCRMLYERLDRERVALTPELLNVAEQISLPAARNEILSINARYVALQQGDLAGAASIRPSSDVEGMSDGELILRKIIEPYKGKLVYLDVWGTWCGPCKAALKESHKLKEALKGHDIVYLYLANHSPEDSWKNVIKEYNLTGENCVHYNLPDEQQGAIERYLNINSYPSYRIIDKEGNIHSLHWRHADDMDAFKRMIEAFDR